MIKMTVKFSLALLILIVMTNTIHAQGFFSTDVLQFKEGNQIIPSSNAGDPVEAFNADFVTLQDGTILDSDDISIDAYIAPLIGSIMAFPAAETNDIPDSWLICDGREVSRSEYPLLFNAIGNTWGEPTDTNKFVLPNLNNFMPRGADNFGTGAAGRDIYTSRFEESSFTTVTTNPIAVGTYQRNAIQTHQHNLLSSTETTNSLINGSHVHTVPGRFPNTSSSDLDNPESESRANLGHGTNQDSTNILGATYNGATAGNHTHTITIPQTDTSFSTAASDRDNGGMPKRVFMVFCIKHDPI